MNLALRVFAAVFPLILTACISSQPYPEGAVLPAPITPPKVRAPKVGQEWVYTVRNVFNQAVVDTVTERVVSVGKEVRIERIGEKAGRLPDEIQSPWGYVLQDPHWSPPQVFQQAMPLWPEQLVPGWSGFYRTRYQALGYPDSSYYWGLNVNAIEWERVSVPAGQFTTLKYQNGAPYFESNDVFRIANYRQEDVWLSPEIGRWVIRRAYGRYITAGVYWANAYWEDYLEWDLVSWK
ncbi:hypothetical protein [Polynucleobacter sp. MWH-Svant-W18]|uniref:hypothetical protein n=1 Tax=Polynucleobacter sp. MWH-Svant-W18 TaxID=1855909 RepID=UPI001BFD5492|nr:hypothetical protein [Polynucleobacter sp. MWH-Svant-W18]QWD78495.1 hypothetical protein C2757_02800 [Polynucleobacter sp. MWH-Svant-W18]